MLFTSVYCHWHCVLWWRTWRTHSNFLLPGPVRQWSRQTLCSARSRSFPGLELEWGRCCCWSRTHPGRSLARRCRWRAGDVHLIEPSFVAGPPSTLISTSPVLDFGGLPASLTETSRTVNVAGSHVRSAVDEMVRIPSSGVKSKIARCSGLTRLKVSWPLGPRSGSWAVSRRRGIPTDGVALELMRNGNSSNSKKRR